LGDNPAIFQNAYSAVAKLGDTSRVVSEPVMVLPATAVSSKTSSGFLPKANGVFDTLIDRFCADAFNFPYDPNCPKDLGRVEPFGGFYSKSEFEGDKYRYRSHSTNTRFLTRVGINRSRATSQEEILYSIEALSESFLDNPKEKTKTWHDYVYRSSIFIEDADLAEQLSNFINLNSDNFRIGGATSRGLGKIKVNATVGDATVDSRIEKFNQKLQERFNLYKSVFGNIHHDTRTYFTLDLQSDTIFTEDWRRTTVLSEAMLQEFTNVSDLSLKLEVAYSSYDYRSGWNSAWGLMKDMELVTNRGAVYLFSTENPDLWMTKLKQLEFLGVGERTFEGFGQVQICNEFHTRFRDDLYGRQN
jgi:CRISPR-associated protein Csx10